MLFEEMSGSEKDNHRLEAASGPLAAPRTASIVELALPCLKGMDPQRVAEVTRALRRLDMLRQDRVLLMMPEIAVRP
ncbi:MAG: hypothetical protein HUU20_18690, partial [Pirellulales bacterium]|nr:hypothetical protein [Pirellulales bacterium]